MKNNIFPYPGSKTRIADKIIKHIPNHLTYVEPFCGSCTILFSKETITPCSSYVEVINDKDENIYNFFVQLRYKGEVRK